MAAGRLVPAIPVGISPLAAEPARAPHTAASFSMKDYLNPTAARYALSRSRLRRHEHGSPRPRIWTEGSSLHKMTIECILWNSSRCLLPPCSSIEHGELRNHLSWVSLCIADRCSGPAKGCVEIAVPTIFPQPHDILMDWIVTGFEPPSCRRSIQTAGDDEQ